MNLTHADMALIVYMSCASKGIRTRYVKEHFKPQSASPEPEVQVVHMIFRSFGGGQYAIRIREDEIKEAHLGHVIENNYEYAMYQKRHLTELLELRIWC